MAFRIGPLSFDGAPWLAPLAAVSSAPFRQICLELGCGQAVTEMVSSEALVRDVQKIARRMTRAPGERVLIVQLFGGNPSVMARAAELAVEQVKADVVDINMGCPVRKVLGTGAGVALMRDPEHAAKVVEHVVRAIAPVPVTVKMRAGWDDEVNAVQVAVGVVQAGAQGLAVHGRTREQYHKGETRWDVIASVKQAVQVPVIGNGGVRSASDAKAMVEQTGCDAVMIGRASLGNPWVFRSVVQGRDEVPSVAERFGVIRQHVALQVAYAGEFLGVREMRKQLGWYLRGLPGSAMVRERLQVLRTEADVHEVLDAYEDAIVRGRARPTSGDFGADLIERSRYGL
jgi:nifR3 family TIM-barrel protein